MVRIVFGIVNLAHEFVLSGIEPEDDEPFHFLSFPLGLTVLFQKSRALSSRSQSLHNRLDVRKMCRHLTCAADVVLYSHSQDGDAKQRCNPESGRLGFT